MKRIFLLAMTLLTVAFIGLFFLMKRPSRPYLTVVGYLKMADGLGRQSAELIDLFKDEMRIGFVPTRENSFKDVPKAVRKIAKTPYPELGKVVIFEDALWVPHISTFNKVARPKQEDQIRIAYSAFESSEIPQEWVLILNTFFDAVAVMDPFLVGVYEKSGVQVPVFVLPLGLDFNHFFHEPLKEKAHSPFVFANLSTCTDRKNQLTLVRAFAKAFGNNPDVKLSMNARYCDPSYELALRHEIKTLGASNIQFTNLELSNTAYLEIFRSVDCYVSLSKGEGFSIQPREAMALGIPVIATDNTAQTTICQSNLVRRVDSCIAGPARYDFADYAIGENFQCTEEDAAEAMLDVYRNYASYLAGAKEARDWASQYCFEHLKDLFRALIKPRRIVLGKENRLEKDTLITTSEELVAKYKKIAE